jgi:aspartate/methionine/tyrosine aminotransferase
VFAKRTQWELATNRFTQAVERRRASGRELLDLSASNPTDCGFLYPEQAILSALADVRALRYAPDPRGLRGARDAVAAYYAQHGAQVSPEDVILTTSTSEAYAFIFRLLCEPGDEVLVPAPSYPLFEFLATIQDVRLRSYPVFYDHGWHVDVHALRQAVSERTHVVMVVNPNNPTGSYLKSAELRDLNALCAERTMTIVADEVFLDYPLDGMARPSLAANEAALTFTLGGLSKLAALPQMKVAWMVVSGQEELKRASMERLEVIADTFLSMNAPIQLAVPRLMELGVEVRRQLQERIAANLRELDGQLTQQKTIARLEIEGGWYAVLRVPVVGSDEELAIRLLDEGVLVHPGHFYDFQREGVLVVSLIARDEEFRAGVRRMVEAIGDENK